MDMPNNAKIELLQDLFTTALAGGIGYWSEASEYDADEHTATIYDVEDYDDGIVEPLTVNLAVVARGYGLATSADWRNRVCWSCEKPPVVVTPDSDWDFDAGDADVVMQLGLFGDIVYG